MTVGIPNKEEIMKTGAFILGVFYATMLVLAFTSCEVPYC